jgi:hypothetical protein
MAAIFQREIRWYWWNRSDLERQETLRKKEEEDKTRIKGRMQEALAANYKRSAWNENQEYFEVYDEQNELFYVGSDYKAGGCIWVIRASRNPVSPADTAIRLQQLHLLDAFLTSKQKTRLQTIVSDRNYCSRKELDDDYWFPCDQQFVEVHYDRSNKLLKTQFFGSEQTRIVSEK